MRFRPFTTATSLAVVLLLASCREELELPERRAGARVGRALDCDPADPIRCALPWPSDAYLRRDATTATGVRVAVPLDALQVEDDPSSLNRADGFSRLTPIVTGLPVRADDALLASAVLRVVCAEPGEGFGVDEALRLRLVRSDPNEPAESLLVGYPRRPLRAASEYVAVVLAPAPLEADRSALLAMGLATPATNAEAELVARQAPARAALAKAGVDPSTVRRVWTFVTRSREESVRPLQAMRAAAERSVGDASPVRITKVERPANGEIAVVIEGSLGALPSWVGATGGLAFDDEGLPIATGTHEAPFRVVVPAGAGDYPMVVFGHGTGGDFDDDAFDRELAARGYGKVGVRFQGFTGDELIGTVGSFTRMFAATERIAARLMESLADAAAIQRALRGPIGEALAAASLAGNTNPAQGRRPDASSPIWAGGSLGGTMGLVHASADPSIRFAVLNVPGAAWSHFIGLSELFTPMSAIFVSTYGSRIDFELAFLQGQLPFDDVDGANWVDAVPDDSPVYLVQESIGDPVLANIGSDMVAASVGAVFVGEPIVAIPGLERVDIAEARTAITQFRVAAGSDATDTHGFASRDAPPGIAAREQISEFLRSIRDGSPRIALPSGCVSNGGSCDFGPR